MQVHAGECSRMQPYASVRGHIQQYTCSVWGLWVDRNLRVREHRVGPGGQVDAPTLAAAHEWLHRREADAPIRWSIPHPACPYPLHHDCGLTLWLRLDKAVRLSVPWLGVANSCVLVCDVVSISLVIKND